MNSAKNQDIELNQYYKIPMPYQQQDDEISLIDIFRILAKHKYLILIITLLVSLAGSAYAFLKEDVFSHATAIQLGSIAVAGGESKPIGDAAELEVKANYHYIPQIVEEYYRQNPQQPKDISISLKSPKGSNILFIKGQCSDKAASVYTNLINKIASATLTELNGRADTYKNTLNLQISNANKRLTTLEANTIDINQRITSFEKNLSSVSASNLGVSSVVITELFGQALSVAREKYNLEATITSKKAELNLVEDAKLLYPTTKSIQPVDNPKKLSIAASILCGLILGVFTALLINFVEKLQSQLNPKTN